MRPTSISMRRHVSSLILPTSWRRILGLHATARAELLAK
jgi:hypothetical protein